MVGFATQLPPLCARPPTPPKESTTKLLNENSLGLGLASHIDLNTPDESPSSSAEYFKGSSEKAQKKVGFTGWTQFHRLSVSDNDYDSDGQLRQLPPSRDCKSLKSILKVRNDTAIDPSINNLLGFDNTNVPAMLRSTVQHLASPSRSSRLDAYINLLACLSAYDDIPDAPDLAEKVTEITGYIRQDVFAKTGEDGALDIQLATQALKLLTVFLCTPSMAMMLPEELCSFILERSIASIEDEGSPKILVSHYMLLLEKQKFSTKYMTIDRVNRLLSALDVVTTRIKGNRVVGHRLMIYQRLLGQAKPLMISRIGSWIDHLISGMLSTIKDIRARSIAFGMQAALQLGTISSVSQLCIEVFNRESADGRKVVDFLCSRLIDLTGSKEDGVQVPQVWSVVILFLRGRRRQLECWEHLKAWLVVVQRCFNSSEAHIKFQANIAWNQLIFAISPDTSTSNSMAKMLRQPIVSQLERKGSDKNSKQAKQIARSSYCILLYYAFRPSATHAQLDQYWDLYVSQILPNCFVNNQMDINHACDILTALFSGNGRPKIRDESKVNMNGPLKAEDLPCLDPKWVRLRAGKILQVFDRFFDVADWQLGREPEAPIVLAWRGFATALGNAGSKEVKVSMDSLSAVAHIINEIKRLLERSNLQTSNERNGQIGKLSSQPEQSDMYEKITVIIREAVARIGNIPFMERRMLLTSQDSFEPADTPSSRTNRDPSSLNSPAAHLLSLLLRNIRDGHITTSHTGAIRAVMHISMQPGGPRRSQLGVIRNLARMLSVHSTLHKGAGTLFWNLLAEATTSALQLSQSNETHNGSPHYSGHEYRDAIKILELGAQQQISHITPNWISLQQCIADTLRQEIGDESISLMMTEPLAAVLNKGDNQCDGFLLSAAGSLIKNAHWPQSSHVLEIMQQRLWGVVQIAHKANLLNLYDKLYSMVNSLLGSSYVCLKSLSTETIMEFMSAVQDLIASCPQNAIGLVLNRIQRGLAYWVEDAGEVLSSSVASATKNLALKVSRPERLLAITDLN